MSVSSRVFALIVSAIAALSIGVIAPPASAVPTQNGYAWSPFSIHFHMTGGCTEQGHHFGDNDSYNSCRGVFTAGHTFPFTGAAPGFVTWGVNRVIFIIEDTDYIVWGEIPNHGSDVYTLSYADLGTGRIDKGPQTPGARPGEQGGPLRLNVRCGGVFAETCDFYLDGYLYRRSNSSAPPSGGSAELPVGIFGSS